MTVIAFFDVDETLINTKSMFDFLRHQRSTQEYAAAVERLGAMARSGVDRAVINRAYYGLWIGADWTQLMAAGRAWWEEVRSGERIGPPFITGALEALCRHQDSGHLVAVMSGSFLPCLQPLVDELGIDLVLCSHPEVDAAGLVTGSVRAPMIGRNKVLGVRGAAARHGADLRECHAYADHISDLPVLRSVGHAVVVGEDVALRRAAATEGWTVISATDVTSGQVVETGGGS